MSVGCQVGKPFAYLSTKQGCQNYQFALVCFLCGGSHQSVDCHVGNPFTPSSMEQPNYMSNLNNNITHTRALMILIGEINLISLGVAFGMPKIFHKMVFFNNNNLKRKHLWRMPWPNCQ